MTIDKTVLDALGDSWMLRTDKDGISYGGYQSAPIGEWNTCPKWSDSTKADCESGGFFGQGPGGFGYGHAGTRLLFCETRGGKFIVNRNKVKVREFRILYEGADAMAAALYKCGGRWPGSLNLRGCALPEGFTIGDVGGWLDLSNCTLPEGFTIGDVGEWLDLRGATLPAGFTIGDVGWWLDLRGATMPEGFKIGDVGGSLYLRGATMPGCKTEDEIRAKITRKVEHNDVD